MHPSKIFLSFLLFFIGGVLWQSFRPLGINELWLGTVVLSAILLPNYKNKKAIFIFLAGIFFILGAVRTQWELQKIEKIKEPIQILEITAKIIAEPEKKEYYQNLLVEVQEKEFLSEGEDSLAKILIRAELFEDFEYGEKIKINCQSETVKNSGSEFDYKMYLAKDQIYYLCKKAKIEKTDSLEKNFYFYFIKIRKILEGKIDQAIPQPEASLANGILFGGNRLSEEKQDVFSKTGMTHIVAVSGYNVTIIAQYLMLLGIWLGFWRKQAFYFAFLGIIIFVAMIGFPSSAVRAGVMGLLILWAIKNGRLANADNALILAGGIMLLINPLLLRWDIGFQLSFLATLGLIKMGPFWENFLMGKPKLLGLVEIVLMTVSAQIFVLPILIYNFKLLSLVSLLANLAVLPIIPFAMLLSFLTALGGLILPFLGQIFGYSAYFLLKYIIESVEWMSGFSWAFLEIESFSVFGVVVWYLGLFWLVKKINAKKDAF
ncbi:MAG: ComEC/Rec2 family competence protein [Candidatus Moraniibacteriota bacterium]